MRDITIGKGNLNGKDVYAKKNFKKEEIVIEYRLKPLTRKNFQNLPESEKMFVHTHQETMYLYSEPERFVNHSLNPNTYQDLVRRCDVAL